MSYPADKLGDGRTDGRTDGQTQATTIPGGQYWERRRDDSLMLATIHDDTWNMLNMQQITLIRKDGIIQTSPVVVLE